MIKTSHLKIHSFHEEHSQEFLELTQDIGFTLFPITDYRQRNLVEARAWIKEAIKLNDKTGLGKWGVWRMSDSLLIGMGGLTPWKLEDEELVDITYRLRESAWGKGYGWELTQALIKYGFETIGLKEITATITPDNFPSKKIAEKLGMKLDKRIQLLNIPTDLYRLKA